MSYRIQGIILALKKAAAQTTGKRTIGQLVHVTNAGEATLSTDDIFFPLTEDFDVAGGDQVASAQVDGIAKVYVETAASIVAGSFLKAGSTGLGAALADLGDNYFGVALATPAGDGEFIPVLLSKGKVGQY